MRIINYEYKMEIKFSSPINKHHFQLRGLLKDNLYQKIISQELIIEPKCHYDILVDGFNNSYISGTNYNFHDYFLFQIKGQAEVEYKNIFKEEAHPTYSFETKLTKYDEEMSSLLPESTNFYEMMMEICRNIYYEIYYTPKATTISTTALEAFRLKKGVCQDFTHIMLALVRHMGYKARYVAGMIKGEGESHAWLEVYNDDKWIGYDPTNNKMVNNEYLVICKGRDYLDCALDKGIFDSNEVVNQDLKVSVKVEILK